MPRLSRLDQRCALSVESRLMAVSSAAYMLRTRLSTLLPRAFLTGRSWCAVSATGAALKLHPKQWTERGDLRRDQ